MKSRPRFRRGGVLRRRCCSSRQCPARTDGPHPKGVVMPQYAALLYVEDLDWSSPEQSETTKQYNEFGTEARTAIAGGAALYPTSTATTVRVRGGRGGDVVTSDGPYAESKEVLGGFYLLEAGAAQPGGGGPAPRPPPLR